MFPMAGHIVQWIWTRFGVWLSYNLRMVMRELFLQRNRAMPEQGTSLWALGCVSCHSTATGRLKAGGRLTEHGVGVLLLQISWCRPRKQYRPDSTVFFVCKRVDDTINALTFSTTCCSHGRLLEVLYHRSSCITEHPSGAGGFS